MKNAYVTLGMSVELRPFRHNYRSGYDVYDVSRSGRGRRIGCVGDIWGANQYKPAGWQAEDARGREVGNPARGVAAMFPLRGRTLPRSGLWRTRTDAVAALVIHDRGGGA